MSKISTLYDNFVTRLEALLPTHKKLSDPYRFLKNTDSEKRQGYGLRILSGSNTRTQISCDIILDQELSLILTRISQGRETDRDKKVEAEKQLLEDLFLIVEDVESAPNLGNPSVVLASDYVSHGGVQFYSTERDDILYLEATFRFRYREDFN